MWMRTIADAACGATQFPRPCARRATAVDRLLEALTSPKLQQLAWSKHGLRGPLGTVAGDANAIAGVRPAEIEAVLPMPSADVMLALLAQMDS